MRIVNPSHTFITPLNRDATLKRIEECGRVCYRSEHKITEDSAPKFVRMVVEMGHHSVIEHCALTVKFVTDNGILRELTRHRIGVSFSVESTRYCSYDKEQFGKEVSFVKPSALKEGELVYNYWYGACLNAEGAYFAMLDNGARPEIARSALPLCTATTIVMTANLREWRHVLRLRCAPAAHPDMRALMKPLLADFNGALPEIFGDVYGECFQDCVGRRAKDAAVS